MLNCQLDLLLISIFHQYPPLVAFHFSSDSSKSRRSASCSLLEPQVFFVTQVTDFQSGQANITK